MTFEPKTYPFATANILGTKRRSCGNFPYSGRVTGASSILAAVTGTIAQAIHDIFGAEVTSIDVVNRFRRDLTIQTAVYDGMTLPFADGAFDAITLNNVIHHVPPENRARLIQECARVCTGPLYVKDHLAVRGFDHVRLSAMDVIGNLPHGGMVRAKYLSAAGWAELRGNRKEERLQGGYRSGLHAAVFPNRLEIFMRWSHL